MRLYRTHQTIEAKLAQPEADAWKKAYELSYKLTNDFARETRPWVIIDKLKFLSKDTEKAAKQIRYWAYHPENIKAEEQKEAENND